MEEWHREINELRSRIYEPLRRGEDTSDLIDGLVCVNCPLGMRYRLLPMEQLFKDNSHVRHYHQKIWLYYCIFKMKFK
jgi:hypothetical protein